MKISRMFLIINQKPANILNNVKHFNYNCPGKETRDKIKHKWAG